MMTKCREHLIQRQLSGLKGQHWRAVFLRGLKSLGACPTGLHLCTARFDSTHLGHEENLLGEFGEGGRAGNGSFASGSCPYTKEKDGCQWSFSQTLIFFQKGLFRNI